jgi:hypothetical protein
MLTVRVAIASLFLSVLVLSGYAWLFARVSTQAEASLAVVVENGKGRALSKRPVSMTVDGRLRCTLGTCSGWMPLASGTPGLHMATWQTRYLGQPPERITHSFLTSRGKPRSQLRLSLAQSLFDDDEPAGKGRSLASALQPVLHKAIARALEGLPWIGRTVVRLLIGAIESVELSLTLRRRGMRVRARVTFALSGQRLSIRARTDLALRIKHGTLRLSRGRLRVAVDRSMSSDSFWRKLRARIGQHVLEAKVPEQVALAVRMMRPMVEEALARALRGELLFDVWQPAPYLRWRIRELSIEPQTAAHLLFDLQISPKKGAHAVKAAYGFGKPLAKTGRCKRVCVALHVDAINALLAHFHRQRSFDRLASAQGRALLSKEVGELLAFRVKAARLQLPPQIWQRHGVWTLGLGHSRFELQQLASSTQKLPAFFDLHAQLAVRPFLQNNKADQELRLQLGGVVEDNALALSCGSGKTDDPLRPCFTAFSKMAAQWLRDNKPLGIGFPLSGAWQKRSLNVGQDQLQVHGNIEGIRLIDRGVRIDGDLTFAKRD